MDVSLNLFFFFGRFGNSSQNIPFDTFLLTISCSIEKKKTLSDFLSMNKVNLFHVFPNNNDLQKYVRKQRVYDC